MINTIIWNVRGINT
ncbi:hypothetical protein RDI58_022226 [Solanum bulbocastanum]